MIFRFFSLSLILIFCSIFVLAKEPICTSPPPQARFGIQIRALPSGQMLYEHNPKEPFIPASTLKLLTLATALEVLGPSFQYETKVFYDGKDLYLQGSGDPSLNIGSLDKLANQIKQLIHKPIHDLIIDDSIFDDQYYGNGWLEEDMDCGYSAPVAGINVNYNQILVAMQPNGHFFMEPRTAYAQLKTLKNRSFRLKAPGINISKSLVESSKPQYETYAIQEAPAKWAGLLFKEALKRAGLSIKGKVKQGLVPSKAKELTSLHSVFLSEMIINFTKYSNNLAYEALLKTLALSEPMQEGEKKQGCFEKGLAIVRRHTGFQAIQDGSGLSMKNTITAEQMTQFLVKIANNFDIGPEFMTAMRLKDGMRYKTGSMPEQKIMAWCGYFQKNTGQTVAFSLFANDLKNPEETLKEWLYWVLNNKI